MRGILLLDAIVSVFLLFLAGMMMLATLDTSDRGYSEAAEARVALRLSRQGLELVRAGTVATAVGNTTLANVTEPVGRSSMVFAPTIVCVASGSIHLIRSQVTWNDGKLQHLVELKTYVP